MRDDDTIVAISSAAGASLRAIVRLSGRDSLRIAGSFTDLPADVAHARAVQVELTLNSIRLPIGVYVFRSPRSYTGQDLVELHVPGSPWLVEAILSKCLKSGARLAEPGEFTARAFFAGRIDLSAAEGVVATIAAADRRQLDAARQLLAGELARRLRPTLDSLTETLALVEAGLDFSDQDISFIESDRVRSRLDESIEQLHRLLHETSRFAPAGALPHVVLAGRPNAGKSTLLNALAGEARAIASDVAGTTRDALHAPIRLRRGHVVMVDVAGLDEADAGDSISLQMIDSAKSAIAAADVLVLVIDSNDSRSPIALDREPDLVVRSKSDACRVEFEDDVMSVSAKTGVGLERLRARLDELVFGAAGVEAAGRLSLNARHVGHVGDAVARLNDARAVIDSPELIAAEIRLALDSLGMILGSVSPDDVLGKIFTSFCIGK